MATARFERDEKLNNEMLKKKDDDKASIVADREKLKQDFEKMKEVQDLIDQENKFRTEIEEMHVKLQYLAVQINILESSTEQLTDKKEDLDR